MEESKENLNTSLKRSNGNFFGWRWSLISLVAIIIGVVALIVIKPAEIENTNTNNILDQDSIITNHTDTLHAN